MDSLKQETGENLSHLIIDNFCLNPDRSTCSYLADDSGHENGFVTLRKQICEKCIWTRK